MKPSKVFDQQRNLDFTILFSTIFLLLSGLAFLGSALVTGKEGSLNSEFAKQLIYMVFGCIIMYGLYLYNYHSLFKYTKPLVIFITICLIILFIPTITADIYARIVGLDPNIVRLEWAEKLNIIHSANNAIRWLKIGPIFFQPSELAKIGLLLFLASQADKYREYKWHHFKRTFYIICAILFMILLQPDLGSVVVIASILLAGLWMSGFEIKYFAIVAAVVIIIGSIALLTTSYRNQRLQAWVYQNFCSQDFPLTQIPPRSERSGICSVFDFAGIKDDNFYQTQQVRNALLNGGWVGVGYNKGDLKNQIPEVTSDGIIGVIGEETGLITVFVMMTAYLVIFYRGMQIASHAPDTAGKIIASGISVWILFQAFWNVTGMTGLIPMKGLPLPFISEGGSALVSNLVAIGILLNISSHTTFDKKQKVVQSKRNFKYV